MVQLPNTWQYSIGRVVCDVLGDHLDTTQITSLLPLSHSVGLFSPFECAVSAFVAMPENLSYIGKCYLLSSLTDFRSAVVLHVQMWTHQMNTLLKWRNVIFLLRCSIRDLLSRDKPVNDEGQRHQLCAVWHTMAEHITLQLCPGEQTTGSGQFGIFPRCPSHGEPSS